MESTATVINIVHIQCLSSVEESVKKQTSDMLMTDWINSTTHIHFCTAATKGDWNLWAPYDINEHIGMTVTKNNEGSYQLICIYN